MKVTEDGKLQLFQLLTAGMSLCASLPGHKPWQHGWTVLLGGWLGHFFALSILSAVVYAGYLKLRNGMIHAALQEHETRPKLQGDEVRIVVCVTLLAVSAFWLLAGAGAFDGISDLGNTDGPTLR